MVYGATDAHEAIDEVIRQHEFIESWLDGTGSEAGFDEFDRSLDASFTIVAPSGIETDKADLLSGFRSASGALSGVIVEIRRPVVVCESGDVVAVRYEEWQLHPVSPSQRVSTAVFTKDVECRLGWSWMTVHETAIAG